MIPPFSLIFAGTGDFGVSVLQKLISDTHFIIPFVVTAKDKLSGRGLKKTSSSIKKVAISNKLIVQQPVKIAELKQKLIQGKPDFLLVVSYGEIIPQEILSIPKFGAINIHPSLLPLYRGASPIQEAMLHGDAKTGITWILMNEKMDSGPIIAQEKIFIDADDNSSSLARKLAIFAAEKATEVLIKFSQTKRARSQDDSVATYCKKIRKEDGFIDVNKETAEEIIRKIRAYTPWPGCYLFLNGKRIKIIQAEVSEQKISSGEIRVADGRILTIGTTKGTLLPTMVQPESKREMSISEFLRGQKNISLLPKI